MPDPTNSAERTLVCARSTHVVASTEVTKLCGLRPLLAMIICTCHLFSSLHLARQKLTIEVSLLDAVARNYVHDRKRENFSNGTTQREKESTKTERQSISDEINTKTHNFQTVNTRNC